MVLTYSSGYCMIYTYPLANISYKGVYIYQKLSDYLILFALSIKLANFSIQQKEALYCLTLLLLR